MNKPEIELGFINCVLQEPDLLDDVMHKVDEEDFTNKRRDIFRIIRDQYMETGTLSRTKFMIAAGDKLEIEVEELFETNYTFALEIEEIVEQLNGYKFRRNISRGLKEIYKQINDEEIETDQLKANVEDKILKITAGQDKGRAIKTFEDIAYQAYGEFEKRVERQKEGKKIDRVKTYYPSLDSKLEGFKEGHLTILAGATSSGKTAFAVNLMKNIINNSDKPVYFISLEMNDVELFDRILINQSRVNASDYSLGDVNKGQFKNITNSFDKIFEKQGLITDKPGLNINQIKSLSRRANKKFDDGLGLIIIDYLTMIKMDSLDNYKTIGSTVTQIRNLAKELKVPILLLHQLNRDLHKRGNPKPKLSDLRDSGEIEERADEVLFVHRPAYFEQDKRTEEELKVQSDVEIIISKNRTGKTADVLFTWYQEILTFQDGYIFENEGPIRYLSKY